MNEIYKSPEAKLNSNNSNDIDNFERFSAWGVFGLSIVTLGIYFMYWFYTRTRTLNEFHSNKISGFIVNMTLASYVAYFASALVPESAYTNQVVIIGVGLVSVLYIIFYLVWLFTFRARLLEIARVHGNTKFTVNPVLAFFFQSIYLQYKINQYIDNKNV